MVPLDDDARSFANRFGMDVHIIFDMTESSSPIVSQPTSTARGACAKTRRGAEVRLVDEHDCEVPAGEARSKRCRSAPTAPGP